MGQHGFPRALPPRIGMSAHGLDLGKAVMGFESADRQQSLAIPSGESLNAWRFQARQVEHMARPGWRSGDHLRVMQFQQRDDLGFGQVGAPDYHRVIAQRFSGCGMPST